MNDLLIEATETSPRVYFSPSKNIFEITGNSRPYNPVKYFDPILSWLESFKTDTSFNNPIHLKVYLEYFNSSSSKILLSVLLKFSELKSSKNIPVSIEWNYDEDDFELRETGKEYERLLQLPFTYNAVND